jgi:hypothetical protein
MADARLVTVEIRILVKTPKRLRALDRIVRLLEELEEDLPWRKEEIRGALCAAKRLLHASVRRD